MSMFMFVALVNAVFFGSLAIVGWRSSCRPSTPQSDHMLCGYSAPAGSQ